MATEICPSSFRCDCGHESDFCENTIREMKAYSKKHSRKEHWLGDSEEDEHEIVFANGLATAVHCPRLGRVQITDYE